MNRAEATGFPQRAPLSQPGTGGALSLGTSLPEASG